MNRRLVSLLVVLAFVATACGAARPTTTDDGREVRWVDVDARTNRFNASFLAYFPDTVTVRPGDQVVFRSLYNGEPHTVTMGTLIDALLADPPLEEPPSLPTWTLGSSEFLPPNVGRQCFLDEGGPPEEPTQSCPQLEERPPFNGRQTYYSSGFLPDGAEFNLRLSDDIAPGRYRFYCAFHGPRMSGELEVAEPGADIPPQGELDAAAREKRSTLVEGSLPVHNQTYEPYDGARAGDFPWPALASFETFDGLVKVTEFAPFTLKARVNERVRWSLLGAHTIAFSAPENAKPPAIRIRGTGETELKLEAINESRSPDPPVGAPAESMVIEAPPYDRGFLSSGMLYSPDRGRIEYVMRFSEPGSYRYECLLHPGMVGLVIVSV